MHTYLSNVDCTFFIALQYFSIFTYESSELTWDIALDLNSFAAAGFSYENVKSLRLLVLSFSKGLEILVTDSKYYTHFKDKDIPRLPHYLQLHLRVQQLFRKQPRGFDWNIPYCKGDLDLEKGVDGMPTHGW